MTHPGGRPPLFNSAEQLQAAIHEYFERCDDNKEPYTVSGLAYHLGMTTESLRRYGESDQFSATVKRAKQRVENYLEKHLLAGKNAAGVIFNLKNNFGWKDKVETEHSGTISWPIPPSPREL